MKMSKLICALLLSLMALAACHSSDESNTASAVASADELPSGSGTATLSWDAPTTTTTGGPLTNLSGYRIYYGISADDLSQIVQLTGIGVETYVVDNLGQGTWYFAIRAVTSAGVESPLSDVVSKTID